MITTNILLLFVVLTVSIAFECTSSTKLNKKWTRFKTKYNKTYASHEECKRYNIWLANVKIISDHNSQYKTDPHVTYKMGMNEHGDRTNEEIIQMYLGGHSPMHDTKHKISSEKHTNRRRDGLRRFYDARHHGCNLLPEDQQPCGSCYAFATLSVIECRKEMQRRREGNRKPFPRLSVQYLLDCMWRYQAGIGMHIGYKVYGCNGGWPEDVFNYLSGINPNPLPFPPAACYQYKAKDRYESKQQMCYNSSSEVVKCAATEGGLTTPLKGFALNIERSETTIKKALLQGGPVVASMAVLPATFRWYKSGVYSDVNCSYYWMNHDVGLWGYGEMNKRTGSKRRSIPYWLVKNSFGTSWGEKGFFKISRNNSENCRLEDYVVFPFVDK